jgi:hypothetical protein
VVTFSRDADLDKQTANPLFTALKNVRHRVAAKNAEHLKTILKNKTQKSTKNILTWI